MAETLEVIALARTDDPERKIKVRNKGDGREYWLIPTDTTNKTFKVRSIQ